MLGQWCSELHFGQNCLIMHISCPLFQPEWLRIPQTIFGGQAKESPWTLLSVLLSFLWISPSLTALVDMLPTSLGPRVDALQTGDTVSSFLHNFNGQQRDFPFLWEVSWPLPGLPSPSDQSLWVFCFVFCFFFWQKRTHYVTLTGLEFPL